MITELFPDNPLIFWFLIAFAVVTLVQLIYFWVFFSRLAFYKSHQHEGVSPPASVVIAANNQYTDLKNNLESILTQDYPNFEVVVVIDNSDDGTTEMLLEFSVQYPNLNTVELNQKLNWFSGRKFPLSLGIKSAKHNLIILTDPACRPEGPKWLEQMVSGFSEKKEIILGYSSYKTQSAINKWFRFTAFYDALFYLSMALAGKPFKGIGKNLSYTRTLFYENKGFSSHYVISAGDDELFVNHAATKSNVGVQIAAGSRINNVKKTSFFHWLAHEKSRLKIRRFFKLRDRLLVRGFTFTAFAFYVLFVSLLVFKAPVLSVLVLFGLRFISGILLFGLIQKQLSEKNLLLASPVFEVLLILIDFFVWISVGFSRKNKWT